MGSLQNHQQDTQPEICELNDTLEAEAGILH